MQQESRADARQVLELVSEEQARISDAKHGLSFDRRQRTSISYPAPVERHSSHEDLPSIRTIKSGMSRKPLATPTGASGNTSLHAARLSSQSWTMAPERITPQPPANQGPLSRSFSDSSTPPAAEHGPRDDVTLFVGRHGSFQLTTFHFGLIAAFVLPFHTTVLNRVTPDIDHWCARPDNMRSEMQQESRADARQVLELVSEEQARISGAKHGLSFDRRQRTSISYPAPVERHSSREDLPSIRTIKSGMSRKPLATPTGASGNTSLHAARLSSQSWTMAPERITPQPPANQGPLSRSFSDSSTPPAAEHGPRDDVTLFVGRHGSFQLTTFHFGLIAAFVLPFHTTVLNRVTPDIDHWCARPDNMRNLSVEQWKRQMIPKMEDGNYSRCTMFSGFNKSTSSVIPCDSWEFDSDARGSYVVQDFSLICDRSWGLPMSTSIFMVGAMCSLSISGPLADRIGRKPLIQFSVVVAQLCGIVILFSQLFHTFLAMRFLLGAATFTLASTSYVLVIEVMAPDFRLLYGMAVLMGHAVGSVTTACLGWFNVQWRNIQIVGMLPALLLLRVITSLSESPRWLLAKGSTEEAEAVIMRAANMNGENLLELKQHWTRTRREIERLPERSVKPRRASSAEFGALRGAGAARDLRAEDDQLEPDLRAEYARSKWSAFGALEILIEVMAPDFRLLYGMAVLMGHAVGSVTTACLGWFNVQWRNIQIVGMLPALLLLRVITSLSESPRWLLAKGSTEEAEAVIMRAANMNGENLLELKQHWTRTRREIERMQVMRDQDPQFFFRFYRMSPQLFDKLHRLVAERLTKQHVVREPITSGERLAMTLRYLSSGNPIMDIAMEFRVGLETAREAIHLTCRVLWEELAPRYMKMILPYTFLGDEAFQLRPDFMRPYPGSREEPAERCFNYRLSRARRCVENSFGIQAARFRIFRGPIKLNPENAEKVVKASCVLHNFLSLEVEGRSAYCPAGFADHEDAFGKVVEGQWRKETATDTATFDLEPTHARRSKETAQATAAVKIQCFGFYPSALMTLAAVLEIPAELGAIVSAARIGRRTSHATALLCAGLAGAIALILSEGEPSCNRRPLCVATQSSLQSRVLERR
ncbi:putative sugar transporter [Ixodes scapularis]